jgi:hypothetical protein
MGVRYDLSSRGLYWVRVRMDRYPDATRFLKIQAAKAELENETLAPPVSTEKKGTRNAHCAKCAKCVNGRKGGIEPVYGYSQCTEIAILTITIYSNNS